MTGRYNTAPTMRSPRLLLIVVLVLVATACGGKQKPSGQGNGPAQAVAAQPGAPPAAGKCPLTDLDPATDAANNRPVLAVKIDGSIASKTPSGQSGLDSADIVYDEPIEGGFGRFLALYQCGSPTRVGPVREARIEDPDLLAQYGSAILASAGGPADVMAKVTATAGLVNADSVRHGTAFSRDTTGRQAPYNLFADPAKLRAIRAPATSTKPLAAPPSQFVFVPAITPTAGAGQSPSPKASPKAGSIKFKLGPQLTYQYDAASNAYLRNENGQPHLTDSGAQIRVVNVVVMWVQMNQGQITDASGTTTTPEPVVTGTGNTMVLTGGVERDGTWSRPDVSSLMSLLDAAGKPIPLTPGNTWIHILPKEEPVYVQ